MHKARLYYSLFVVFESLLELKNTPLPMFFGGLTSTFSPCVAGCACASKSKLVVFHQTKTINLLKNTLRKLNMFLMINKIILFTWRWLIFILVHFMDVFLSSIPEVNVKIWCSQFSAEFNFGLVL